VDECSRGSSLLELYLRERLQGEGDHAGGFRTVEPSKGVGDNLGRPHMSC